MTIFVHTLTHEGKNLLMSKSCKGCNVERVDSEGSMEDYATSM